MQLFKTLIFTLLLLLSYSFVKAQTVSFQIQDPSESGKIIALLFNSAQTFPKNPFQTKRFSVVPENHYVIEDIPPGTYVLMVYEDSNQNERLDKNFIGIPKEPIGFSNQYVPKGPPNYKKAQFTLEASSSKHFEITLKRPLGKRGRLGVGVGVVAQTQPYKDSNTQSVLPILAISYLGERIQILGPEFLISITAWKQMRFAWVGSLRIRAYEDDDSPYLEGLGDRKTTFLMGPALKWELPYNLEFSASYRHDTLNRIGGGNAEFSLEKSVPLGNLRLSPKLNASLLTEKLSQHDFGISPNQTRPNRPAYSLNNTWNWGPGMGIFWELTNSWSWIAFANLEFLDPAIKDSPIVDQTTLITTFSALTYLF